MLVASKIPATVPTGISGLDDILRGGLPCNRIYLVKGAAGTGKTTLGLQFLIAGAQRGEACLYISLSETTEEMNVVAASHGWTLENISMVELPRVAGEAEDTEYTMYHSAEVELSKVMAFLLAEVERVRPARIVFDSLSEIRLLAEEPRRYRRQVLHLKQHLLGMNCTVLLIDDQVDNRQLDSLANGIISLERHTPLYGGVRRRLEVVKLRAVAFRDGSNDCAIVRGGIQVYPRLVASEHQTSFEHGTLSSGVVEIDNLLGGNGLDRGTSTLVLGPTGTGKSALAAQFTMTAAGRGERAVIYSFDEVPGTMFHPSSALGAKLRAHAEADRIRVRHVDPAETSPGQLVWELRDAVEHGAARVVVIDSLTGYLSAMADEKLLPEQLHELFTFLNESGVVTIMIATQHGIIGPSITTPLDVSYLADTVVLLRYFEAAGRVRNAISVIKRRSGDHERTIREFALGPRGIVVGEPLRNFHGVLTGSPTYTGAPEPLLGRAT